MMMQGALWVENHNLFLHSPFSSLPSAPVTPISWATHISSLPMFFVLSISLILFACGETRQRWPTTKKQPNQTGTGPPPGILFLTI